MKNLLTVEDLLKNLLESSWNSDESNNLQETHIFVNLYGDRIYGQYVCVTEGGSMFDCNVFAEGISAEGFLHLFANSNWFTIDLNF